MGAKQPTPEPRRTYIQPGGIEFGWTKLSFRQRYECRIDRGLEVCSRFFDVTEPIFGLFGMVIGFPFAALGWLFPERPKAIEFIYIPAETKPVSPPAPPKTKGR